MSEDILDFRKIMVKKKSRTENKGNENIMYILLRTTMIAVLLPLDYLLFL